MKRFQRSKSSAVTARSAPRRGAACSREAEDGQLVETGSRRKAGASAERAALRLAAGGRDEIPPPGDR